jgi:hypothetical protein
MLHCEQQAEVLFTQWTGVCAGSIGNATSSKLQIMTTACFMHLVWHIQCQPANHFLAPLHQFLTPSLLISKRQLTRYFTPLPEEPRKKFDSNFLRGLSGGGVFQDTTASQ